MTIGTLVPRFSRVRWIILCTALAGLFGSSAFGLPTISWRIAPTLYATDDVIVAGLSIADFGVTGDGITDVTRQFQTALNMLGAADPDGTIKGGTLFVPKGFYVIRGNLTIPKGVTLAGDWQNPKQSHKATGTVLMAYAGRGNPKAKPFIVIQPNAMLRDVNIWYPDQTPGNIVPYPASVRLFDQNVWGADGTWVMNVTLVNSYFGIQQGPAANACANVRNVYGSPLFMGIDMDGSADIDRWDFIEFSPLYWAQSGLPGSPAVGSAYAGWIRANGTGIALGRIDWSYLSFAKVDGYHRGLYFRESTQDSDFDGYGNQIRHSFPDGQCYGVTLVNCDTGLEVEGTYSVAEMLSNFTIAKCRVGVAVNDNPFARDGVLEISNSKIGGTVNAVVFGGQGKLLMRQVTITDGSVVANKGNLTFLNSSLANMSPQIILNSGSLGAVIAGSGNPRIQNNGAYQVIVDPAIQNLPTPSAPPTISYLPHAPTQKVLYVATESPFFAPSDNSGDASQAIQDALDYAGGKGGGIVFLPPGKYKLMGTLHVPKNVELKGAVDIGRLPIKLGTIFNVYSGYGNAAATPIVTLSDDSGIRGIVFNEPVQDYNNIVPYPYVIQGAGANVYAINIAFSNIYNGIDLFTNKSDNHYVDYLAGAILNTAIRVGSHSIGGRVINMQMNLGSLINGAETKWGQWETAAPAGQADTYAAIIEHYMQLNADIAIYGDTTGELLYNNFSIFGRKGVYLKSENGTGPSGWAIGQGVDQSRHSIYIEDIGSAGMDFVNTQLVSVNYWGLTDNAYITTAPLFTRTANFFNTSGWGVPVYNLNVGGGKLGLYSAGFTIMGDNLFADVAQSASLELWNAFADNGAGNLAVTNPSQISVYSSLFKTIPNPGVYRAWVDNLKVIDRWDVPVNAIIAPTDMPVFAEGFTAYPNATQNSVAYAVLPTDSFSETQSPSADANVVVSSITGNDIVHIYSGNNSQQSYAFNHSTNFESGTAKSLYKLEARFMVASIRPDTDAMFFIDIHNMDSSNQMAGPQRLLTLVNNGLVFGGDGVGLGTWTTNTWYRVSVEIDTSNTADKKFRVSLLNDSYGPIAVTQWLPFGSAFQNNTNGIGNFLFNAWGQGPTSIVGSSDVLLDYVLVTQVR